MVQWPAANAALVVRLSLAADNLDCHGSECDSCRFRLQGSHRPAASAALDVGLPLAAQVWGRAHAGSSRHVQHLIVIPSAAAVPCSKASIS